MKTRKMQRGNLSVNNQSQQVRKRAKLNYNNDWNDFNNYQQPQQQLTHPIDGHSSMTAMNNNHFRIQQKDKVEKKVELIFKDAQNNSYNSLTIWGTGLDVERTIGVVEELKRIYVKQGKSYSQETSIKTSDNNEPHLQVILTMLDNNNISPSDI